MLLAPDEIQLGDLLLDTFKIRLFHPSLSNQV